MNKQEFIESIRTAHPDWDNQQIVAYANTPRTIPNPISQPTILKPVDFSAVGLSVEDRFIVQNTCLGTYNSLIQNLEKGLIASAKDDVGVLMAKVSSDGAAKIYDTMQDVLAGMPDPNWPAEVYQPPCQDYGLAPLILSDIE
ncbi:MAG: hypothetical protein IM613_12770 [Cytophagales bacterium]|nr:hypothetical protein [Cytophagales bacterium]